MPIPLIALAIPAAITGITELCVTIGGAWAAAGVIADVIDGAAEWFESDTAWEFMTERLNAKLAAAGLELQFPTFNPLTDEGQAIVKRTIEAFAVQRINARAGTEFATLEGLNQDVFLSEVGRSIASQVNAKTGANLGSVWPVDKLQGELKTEVLRQFENRGRYAGGSLFKVNSLAQIKTKIAGKYPVLFKAVEAQRDGGYWGPPKDEKQKKRREAGRIRQERYRASHQQVWVKK